jgi:hypothetical protein
MNWASVKAKTSNNLEPMLDSRLIAEKGPPSPKLLPPL